MRNNVPTGNPVIDAITRFFDWLDKQIDQVAPHAAPAATAHADMTDEQLHHAIHDVGAQLLNDLAPVLQSSFAGDAAHGDLRFPHGMPTGVRAHTLTLFAQAHDAFGFSVIGLGKHATAAALGPIRNIAEALALTRWLLESSDDDVRRACAYGLTLDAVDQYRKMARALGQSPQTRQLAPRLAAAEKQMRRNLTRLAEQDGITIEARPGSLSGTSPSQAAWLMPCSPALGFIPAPPAVTCSTAGREPASLITTSRACSTSGPTGSRRASGFTWTCVSWSRPNWAGTSGMPSRRRPRATCGRWPRRHNDDLPRLCCRPWPTHRTRPGHDDEHGSHQGLLALRRDSSLNRLRPSASQRYGSSPLRQSTRASQNDCSGRSCGGLAPVK
jgi:hypothetical protein